MLKVKIKFEIKISHPGSSPKPRLPRENDSPDPPSGPPEGRGAQEQKQNRPYFSWGEAKLWHCMSRECVSEYILT